MSTFRELVSRYTDLLKEGEPDENYKYTAMQQFQDSWDLQAIDFYAMFKKSFSKKENLFFQNSYGFIEKCAHHFPDETRSLFFDLYDESKDLKARLIRFQEGSEELLVQLKELLNRDNLNAQQDERTLSAYLAFRYPEKYILYKADFYKNYCQYLGISSRKAGERYLHLQDLASDIINQSSDLEDPEFLKVYRSYYKQPSWDDRRLMIQNVLYVMLKDAKKEVSNEPLLKLLRKYNLDELKNYYVFLDEILDHLGLDENDDRVVFNESSGQINLTVGQKYAWCLKNKKKTNVYRALSNQKFSDVIEIFSDETNKYLNDLDDIKLIKVHQNDITTSIKNELDKTNKSSYSKFKNLSFEKLAFDKQFRTDIFDQLEEANNTSINNEIKSTFKNSVMKPALNQILYGPPGTGKTYNAINKALSIINPKFDLNQKRELVKKEFDRLVEAGQIVFTTFHQSMTYEDFIEGIKPLKPEAEDEFVKYDIQNGIFKNLCINAREEKELEGNDNFDDSWNKLISLVKNQISNNELLKIGSWEYGLSSKESLKYSSINSPSQYTFTITKQNILDAYQNKQARPSGAFQKDMEDVVEFMKENCELKPFQLSKDHYTNNDKYLIIIDEINRGNVSQIFGELITLIEEDKRIGNNEELYVTLPYSKEKFGVPANLYIIGTMNTADRSVEALDSALRRRFVFEEMPPKYDLDGLQNPLFGYSATQILKTINKRIEKLLDRDHQIGHAYFLNKNEESLINSFYKNIIPLLQEYFFGDYAKIGLVLGSGFVKKNEEETVFATVDYIDASDYDERASFEIVDHQNDELGFRKAINLLMA